MANKENLPPLTGSAYISRLSPNNKPALRRQRDHSACGRPEAPLKVRKTRENLKQQTIYDSIPPPCIHSSCNEHPPTTPVSSATALISQGHRPTHVSTFTQDIDTTPVPLRRVVRDEFRSIAAAPEASLQRQKSASRRMLSRVKQSIGTRSRSSQSVRPTESDTSLVRRLSGRRKYSHEIEPRAHSFEISRTSIDSNIDETPESLGQALSSEQYSVTASTVSTAELLGTHGADNFTSRALSAVNTLVPSPTLTPRLPPKTELPPGPTGAVESLQVPCIDLCVSLSNISVDLHSKHDIWVAIEATVRSMAATLDPHPVGIAESPNREARTTRPPSIQRTCGTISTLRLCYKPVGGCTVREVVGQRSMRDLVVGQQCSLFVKIHVPRLRIKTRFPELDPDNLFAELESIVGTLRTEILHVEARYRHTLLPSDNVVTVRYTCKIKRPEAASRWSLADSDQGLGASSDVHILLAQYIAARYSAGEALEMFEQHLAKTADEEPVIRHLQDNLRDRAHLKLRKVNEGPNPFVVVTDSELDTTTTVAAGHDHFAIASKTPLTDESSTCPAPQVRSVSCRTLPNPIEQSGVLASTPPIIPIRKTMARSADSALLLSSFDNSTPPHRPPSPTVRHDAARELWQHIRRSSLSASQLHDPANGAQQIVEQSDETVRDLHRQAIANKRSVGAETLRAWRWDHRVQEGVPGPEAPWM